MPLKKPFTGKDRKFNLKMLFVGNSGSGKTDFAASYTAGPTHFYMFDKGGEKTIEKKLNQRKGSSHDISVDIFSSNDHTFSDFWHQYEQDGKDGFFDEMASQNGLVVFDSTTALNMKALTEVKALNSVGKISIGKPLNLKNSMNQPYWGQLLSWISTFMSSVQELPCAVIVTAHLHILMNSNQEVVARYPYVNGQFRQLLPVDFDECYLMESRGSTYKIHFKETNKFEAKSRVFSMKSSSGKSLDDLAKAYINKKETF